MKLRSNVGIIALVALVVFIYISFLVEVDKSLETEGFVLSSLGTFPNSAFIFNSGLIISGIFLTYFLHLVFSKYKISEFQKIYLSFPGFSLIVIGMFRYDYFPSAHWIAALSFFISFPVVIMVYSYLRSNKDWKGLFILTTAILQITGFAVLGMDEVMALAAELWFGIFFFIQVIFLTTTIEDASPGSSDFIERTTLSQRERDS